VPAARLRCPEETSLSDVQSRANSPVAGHALRGAELPSNLLVVTIRREGETILPPRQAGLKEFFNPPVNSN
jgi:hypothetical protein